MKLYAKLLSVAGMVAAVAACDRQGPEDSHERTAANTRSTTQPATPAAPATEVAPKDEAAKVPNADTEDAKDASELVKDATQTLRKMKADQGVKTLLSKAKGVFIVPDYGRGAVGVGIRGGEGALLAKEADQWNGPLFYDIGGISVGAQFGGEGGEIAMLLMSDQALRAFKADNTFSLNAGAKLTVVDYSALSEASLGKDVGDVVFWSDTEGAFAGAALSATDISWDDEENPAYYGKKVAADDVLRGNVPSKPGPLAQELKTL